MVREQCYCVIRARRRPVARGNFLRASLIIKMPRARGILTQRTRKRTGDVSDSEFKMPANYECTTGAYCQTKGLESSIEPPV